MAEYKPKEGMMDNRMVHDDHKQGIHRVLQKKHDPKDYCGHFGAMGGGWKHGKGSEKGDTFKRTDASLTPRQA